MIQQHKIIMGLFLGSVMLYQVNLLHPLAAEAIHQVPALTLAVDDQSIDSIGPGIPASNKGPGIDVNYRPLYNGTSIAEYAVQFVGNPYSYGGTSLTSGADCSGFTQSVFREFNIQLPRTSGEQRRIGVEVDSLENAIPGDLITYSGHVGIYIGDGKIVHSSTPKEGITISPATIKTILSIRRVTNS